MTTADHGAHTGRDNIPKWMSISLLAFAVVGLLRPARADREQSGGRHGVSRARGGTAQGRQHGRGRSAHSPEQIPARGWRDVFWRVYGEISNDRILAVAAGVTFYALLAIFPAIAALVSLYGLFADPMSINQHLQQLAAFLPGGAMDIISEQVTRIASQGTGELGSKLVIGLAISLWSANSGVKAVFDALNVAYEEEEKRSFLVLNAQSLLFTFGALLAVIVAIGVVVVAPVLLDRLGLGAVAQTAIAIVRWPLMLVLLLLALAVLYRFGPSRDRPQWRWVTPGSLFAAVGWLIFSLLFSWYVANFGTYDATYGSLGAVIGFMTWIWLSTVVILIGAEVNAETEHQTARDTTDGPPRPMGARGAAMADTIGPAQD